MSRLLWQKPGISVNQKIQDFLAADDVILDREFFLYDIKASIAHAEGLQRIGIFSKDDLVSLKNELNILSTDFQSGAFVLDESFEDGHSAIEARLTEQLGDLGRKIHTGRSRNDQILVATRLWLKQQLRQLSDLCITIADTALNRAENEAFFPLPGYTHIQRAVVSSSGMWWSGWAEAFIDNASRAVSTFQLINSNPLGTAAGYGVNLALDRAHTTAALEFERMQLSPVYAQLSRGKFEMTALEALSSATLDLRRIAWDLSLFTSSEFGFVELPAHYTTGSSIMPNKRNPDVIELLRATHASIAAARLEIEQLLSLPSGYQRDLQISKGALVRGFKRGMAALELLPELFTAITWREQAIQAALEPSMYATDAAVEAAMAGVPFRQAYQTIAEQADKAGQGRTPQASLQARISPGAAGNLQLDTLRAYWIAVRAHKKEAENHNA